MGACFSGAAGQQDHENAISINKHHDETNKPPKQDDDDTSPIVLTIRDGKATLTTTQQNLDDFAKSIKAIEDGIEYFAQQANNRKPALARKTAAPRQTLAHNASSVSKKTAVRDSMP